MDTGQERTDTGEPVRKNRTAFAKQASIGLYALSGLLVIAVLCTTALVWGSFAGAFLASLLLIGLVVAAGTFLGARRMWALRESHAPRRKVLRSLIPTAALILVGVGLVFAAPGSLRDLVLAACAIAAVGRYVVSRKKLAAQKHRGQVDPRSASGS